MGSTHHLVANVRFREAKSTVGVKSVLGEHSVFLIVKSITRDSKYTTKKIDHSKNDFGLREAQ